MKGQWAEELVAGQLELPSRSRLLATLGGCMDDISSEKNPCSLTTILRDDRSGRCNGFWGRAARVIELRIQERR